MDAELVRKIREESLKITTTVSEYETKKQEREQEITDQIAQIDKTITQESGVIKACQGKEALAKVLQEAQANRQKAEAQKKALEAKKKEPSPEAKKACDTLYKTVYGKIQETEKLMQDQQKEVTVKGKQLNALAKKITELTNKKELSEQDKTALAEMQEQQSKGQEEIRDLKGEIRHNTTDRDSLLEVIPYISLEHIGQINDKLLELEKEGPETTKKSTAYNQLGLNERIEIQKDKMLGEIEERERAKQEKEKLAQKEAKQQAKEPKEELEKPEEKKDTAVNQTGRENGTHTIQQSQNNSVQQPQGPKNDAQDREEPKEGIVKIQIDKKKGTCVATYQSGKVKEYTDIAKVYNNPEYKRAFVADILQVVDREKIPLNRVDKLDSAVLMAMAESPNGKEELSKYYTSVYNRDKEAMPCELILKNGKNKEFSKEANADFTQTCVNHRKIANVKESWINKILNPTPIQDKQPALPMGRENSLPISATRNDYVGSIAVMIDPQKLKEAREAAYGSKTLPKEEPVMANSVERE